MKNVDNPGLCNTRSHTTRKLIGGGETKQRRKKTDPLDQRAPTPPSANGSSPQQVGENVNSRLALYAPGLGKTVLIAVPVPMIFPCTCQLFVDTGDVWPVARGNHPRQQWQFVGKAKHAKTGRMGSKKHAFLVAAAGGRAVQAGVRRPPLTVTVSIFNGEMQGGESRPRK